LRNLSFLTPTLMWFLAAIFYGYEFFQRVAPTIMATPIMNTFHLNHASFALVSSLYLYAYALAQLPAGALLDKYGPKICLSLSALGVALGTLLFSETENLLFLGLGRILIGIGSAFAFIGCLKLATQWFEGKTFGLIVGLTNLIGVLGALVGEAPLAELVDHYGWINSLKFSGFLGLFIALILFLFIQNTPSQSLEKKAPIPLWPCFKKLIKTPQNWLIGIYAGLMVSPVIAFTELWAVPFLQTAHHLNSVKAAAVNQFIFIGIAIGGPTHGLLARKLGYRKPIMGFFQLMAALSLCGIIFWDTAPQGLMVLMFIFGFSTSSMLLSFALATEWHSKELSAMTIAFTNLFIMLIGAAFQNLIGDGLTWMTGAHGITNSISLFKAVLSILPIALMLNFGIWFLIQEKSKCPELCPSYFKAPG
jgi:sugar phosphate permease